ncbi:mannose-6-phosphate isomerase, class I [Actinomycetes bacterium NPDC127524]
MKNEPIFLTPIFQERIWGGTKLQEVYEYEIPSNQTGECWAISGHTHGQSIVSEGTYKGRTLGDLWHEYRFLFGNYESETFPLLTKILDANDDLSVQVHPYDQYAKEFENGELGKTECWYIIECEQDAEIIIGHKAETKEEFIRLINNGQWDDLLHRVKIKPGDFFYVPSGTLHALCKGTLVLETQQSSDRTYRVYDYNRRDQNGQLRDLHLKKAIDVTTVPHNFDEKKPEIISSDGVTITTFVKEQYFSVYKWDIHSGLDMTQDQPFIIISVIEGDGVLKMKNDSYKIHKGHHFILPHQLGAFTIEGTTTLIVSHP